VDKKKARKGKHEKSNKDSAHNLLPILPLDNSASSAQLHAVLDENNFDDSSDSSSWSDD